MRASIRNLQNDENITLYMQFETTFRICASFSASRIDNLRSAGNFYLGCGSAVYVVSAVSLRLHTEH